MRLSGLLSSLPLRLQEAQSHQLPHEQFLEMVFQDEINIRQQRLIEKRIKAGFQVLYCSIFDLVRQLQAEHAPAELDRTMSRYLKPDLLIIDDMGLKVLPHRSGEALLEIIMRRYENRSTLMTSNRPVDEWGKLLNDVAAATAILDRFLHHAQSIKMTGPSYRLHQAGRQNGHSAKNSKETQKPAPKKK